MGIILWIIFGAMVGWIASILMHAETEFGLVGDILLGIVGAVVGGLVFSMLGGEGVTGFNLTSFLIAIVGSVIVIYLGRLFRRA